MGKLEPGRETTVSKKNGGRGRKVTDRNGREECVSSSGRKKLAHVNGGNQQHGRNQGDKT